MDEIALLKGLRADPPAMTGEAEAAARARLLAETSGTVARSRRGRRTRRTVLSVLAATAVATAAVLIVPALGSGPVRSYANAAMRIEGGNGTWKVEIKDAYADPGEFERAFAKVGLDVELRIVPVTPRGERRIIQVAEEASGTGSKEQRSSFSVDDCPRGRPDCPLSMTISADADAEGGRWRVLLGRKARPGETYADSYPVVDREPVPGLKLIGRSVRDAVALLRERGLKAAFLIGEFKPDGSGMSYDVDPSWRPPGGREVTGAWYSASDAVTLLVPPRPGDPGPTPGRDPFTD